MLITFLAGNAVSVWIFCCFRSWRSHIFSKIITNRHGSVDKHTIWELVASSYAAATILLRQWRSRYALSTLMALQLRPCYDIGDGATLSLRFCIIYIYNLKFNWFMSSWMSMIDALKSLCFSWPLWTTVILCWMIRSRQDGGGGPHGSGSVHDYPQTDGYNFGTMTNWKIALNSSITWAWKRSEVVLESKIATPTLGEHLNQAMSWPECQERSGSMAEAPMLTMSK